MLQQRINNLGESIKEMQSHNFAIEDDVLEKLSVLRSFNEDVRQVRDGAQTQCRNLRQSIDANVVEHQRAISDQDDSRQLVQKLINLEQKLTDLRVEADRV